GAWVPADLGLVVDPAERDPDELATERPRDGLAERRLADARRANEREDRARAPAGRRPEPALLPQREHRGVLDDPVLHVGQAGVVLVQDRARRVDLEVVLRADVPRDLGHPGEVGADPAVLGRLLRHRLETTELALGLLPRALRHVRVGDLLPVLLHDPLARLVA